MAQLNLTRPIIFFDLETTGMNHAKDRIVEMALVKLLPGGARDSYVKRINPEMPIPAEVSAIHGIFDEDVKNAPTFKHVAHHLYEWMRGCDLGGYNSSRFDLPVLAEEFLRCGIQVDFEQRRMIDAQQIFFKMEQRTLTAAYKFYCNKAIEKAHSAEADILATIEVLEAQIDRYEELTENVEHLHELSCSGDECVDFARSMVKKNGKVVFNFGKHKNKCVEEVFTREPGYYDWMMKSDFTLHTKQKISEILNRMKLARLKVN
jgi:DNA polymerase-3 subunit epsilon